MSELRCPGCTAGACRCRGDQLALDVVDVGREGDKRQHAVPVGRREQSSGATKATYPSRRTPAPERAEVVAYAEQHGRRVWTLRAAVATSSTVAWCLIGGPCEGTYDACSSWPPPETIRAVHGGRDGNAVLDLPDDEPAADETLELYQLASHGFVCGSKKLSGLVATYFPAGFTEAERMAASRKLWESLR